MVSTMARFWIRIWVCASITLICASFLKAEECHWNLSANLGLDPRSFDIGANTLRMPDIPDSNGCQKACCGREDCQLAVMGTPADDGTPECFLVRCIKDGKDVCLLQPSTQFKVFRKMQPLSGELPDDAPVNTRTTDHCLKPSDPGMCRAAFPMFYYDSTSGSCSKFIYGGCGGNKNRFSTQEECMESCAGQEANVTPKPRKVAVPTSKNSADQCMMPSDPGMCRAAFPMFYYDSTSGSCTQFIYGGCGGNKNRFSTQEDCMETCQEGHFHGRRLTPGRWTPAVFLVATVAIICALLLVGLMTISVRKFRLTRLSHYDDQQDLLPDDDLLDGSQHHIGKA